MGNTCILTFSGTGPLAPPFNGTYLCWNGPYMKSRLYQRCHYCIIVAILAEYFRLLHHGVEVGRSEDLVTTVTFEAPFVHRFPICHHITFLAVKSLFKYLHICKTYHLNICSLQAGHFCEGGLTDCHGIFLFMENRKQASFLPATSNINFTNFLQRQKSKHMDIYICTQTHSSSVVIFH